MDEREWLAQRFEENRSHLRAVAYRMLGSVSEADDAVQEAWIRLSRSHSDDIENLAGWLTSIVGRVCLDMLRSRRARREDPLDAQVTEPALAPDDAGDPEHQALIADSVGLALLVVLETLEPAERLAFVLHDMFAVPFDEIAPIVDRTPTAARQLASRARRRVQGAEPVPDPDLTRQRQVVDAFLAAARGGDFEALVAVLDPDVVARTDVNAEVGRLSVIRGAAAVAKQALTFAQFTKAAQPALVNGAPGVVANSGGQQFRVMAFKFTDAVIVEIDVIADPARLRELDLAVLQD
ncbi:sigma-70 family RNA polymerase sigma factor [Streptomyces sp. TLI_146]|uniref:sigma-70 family RNA polymerase sigma factor n=1 Tax=Streptomyces sp. TLI_146 TaxID=1938858 RepID=UPI000C711719|nr:sigma-70 family RNA polymerase sigma factor [Streptomyces sp. TLI_146]PKV87816.1 RNA polymerase ECF family sigma subunit [Streptomyces sp. TLI_146]